MMDCASDDFVSRLIAMRVKKMARLATVEHGRRPNMYVGVVRVGYGDGYPQY
jgi:hypothetical protein